MPGDEEIGDIGDDELQDVLMGGDLLRKVADGH